MNIHVCVARGLCLIGVLGIVACGSDGDGRSQGKSSGLADGETEARVDVLTAKHVTTGQFAMAWFTKGRSYGPGSKCTESQEGSCTLTSCEAFDQENPPHPPISFSAGPIALSGAKIPANVALQPGDENIYRNWWSNDVAWVGGESIRIVAAGAADGVPAFEALLPAPSLITLTKPYWGLGSLAVDRSKDLELAWTHSGAASGTLNVRLSGGSQDFRTSHAVVCAFPMENDAAVVPASVLGKIRPTALGSIAIETAERQTVVAGSWHVNVSLRTEGAQKDGLSSSGSANFQ